MTPSLCYPMYSPGPIIDCLPWDSELQSPWDKKGHTAWRTPWGKIKASAQRGLRVWTKKSEGGITNSIVISFTVMTSGL